MHRLFKINLKHCYQAPIQNILNLGVANSIKYQTQQGAPFFCIAYKGEHGARARCAPSISAPDCSIISCHIEFTKSNSFMASHKIFRINMFIFTIELSDKLFINVPTCRYLNESKSSSSSRALNRVKFKAVHKCFEVIGFKPHVSLNK